MKTKILFFLFLLLAGCSSSDRNSATLGLLGSSKSDYVEEAAMPEAEEKSVEPQVIRIKQPDKIIKEAQIQFEVDNYKTAKKQIDSLVNRWGGYIAKEDEQYSSNQIDNAIIIRVHNSHFEQLLNAISETSKRIDYKSVNSIDVTEEYIDIASRLKTKREVEKRYYEILKKAADIEDILKVEDEIRKIREEIEAKEGRLKYLDDRVSYSTITLTIYQKLSYKYKPGKASNFFSRLYKALDKGWKGLLSVIIALFHIWPILLIVAIGLFFFFRQERKMKKEKGKKE